MAITWKLEDHLCRKCGGRILRSVSGAGPSPGGNPIFRCADCGVADWGTSPKRICWCGMSHRGQYETPYLCLPYSILEERPELKELFRASGCDPDRPGEVGVVAEKDLREMPHD